MEESAFPGAYTCTHDVLPEERYTEESGEHGQAGAHPGEGLGEATALGAETRVASGTHDAVGVDAQDVVLLGVQIGCLHQLNGRRKTCVKVVVLHEPSTRGA